MTKQLNDRIWYDKTLFRVWPDGTVQEADQVAYPWMSDDHALVWANDEDEALVWANVKGFQAGPPELRINWLGVVLVAYVVFGTAAIAWQAVLLIKWVASKL